MAEIDVKNNYTLPTGDHAFESGNILYAEDVKKLAEAVRDSANAQNTKIAIENVTTQLSGKIDTTQTDLEDSIADLRKDMDGSIEQIDKDLAARGVGLYFDESKKTLHMAYEDETLSDGIAVATDLTGYATEQHVEQRLNVGTKTVKQYVDEKVATVDLSKQLENYYTKPQVDIMDVDVVDQGQTIGIALRGADGVLGEYHSFPKATNSEYYRITPVTVNSFNTIPGNDKTPQKIQYKAGHMRGESGWGNELYFERWTTQVDGNTTNTITRSNYFIDITSENYQEFDFIPYLGNGITAVTLEIFATSDYSSSFKGSNTWQVTKIDFDLSVEFPGPQECGVNSTIACTLPSGTEKRLELYLDGELYDSITLASNVISHEFVLTSLEHGAKLAQVNMETTIDGQNIPAIPATGSLVWYDKNNNTPIIALRQTAYNVEQYDIVPITFLPYAYFDGSDKNNLNLKVYSNETGVETMVADETVVSNIAYTWNYPAEKIADNIQLKLVLSHSGAESEKTITVNVSDGSYNFAPVSGDNYSFIPRNYSNNSFVNNSLTISDGVTLTLSDNFNLNSGGFRKEGETTYFKVPAYNKIRISGKGIFNTAHDSHFKLVFKTANARYNDVVFLTTGSIDEEGIYTAADTGLQLTTNHGYVVGNDTVRATSVFTTEEVIDYAFNVVNPTKHDNKTYTAANEGKIPAGYREGDYRDLTLEKYMIMPYEDGVASLPAVYTENTYNDGFFEDVGDCIEIGSNDCDVYIYTIRSYAKALGIDDICKNFVADGTTLLERRERYDRNNWNVLSNNILKDPELAAKILPEVKIVLITAPKFTNDKKDKVGDTYIQVLQNTVTRTVNGKLEPVDIAPFNWITKGGKHSGQGTSSNAYGFSGRNLSLFLGDVVYEGATSIYSPTNASHGTLENFATTKGWTLKDEATIRIKPDSIPADIFNIKVNIASSENANNALMAMMYDKLNNEVYKRPAKLRNPNIKDTIEFDNCLIYVRETALSPADRREFLVEDDTNIETWHFYGIGNFGDHKDTDATRIDKKWNGTEWVADPKEVIVEILDYNVPLAGFNNYQQRCGIEPFNHGSAEVTEKEYEHLEPDEYSTFNDLLTYKTNTDDGEHYGLYEYDSDDEEWSFEGFGVLSKASKVEPESGENYYKEELECSYEFRYEDEDISKTQRDTNILLWNEFYRKIYELYTALETKTSTVEQVIKELKKYMIVDSAILYHIFTERYSLIDNRAKNSFWHYSKKYYTKAEAASLDQTVYASMIDDAAAAINEGYRWDLCFGYDFDTSLGIDNVGKLVFEYGQETSSREFRTEIKYVENGEIKTSNGFSYFFELINNFGYETLSAIYNATDTTTTLFDSTSINGTIHTWDKSQKQIPEKVWLRDIERKYLRTSGDFQLDGSITSKSAGGYPQATLDMKAIDTSFLIDKANGLKRYHRHDFEKKQSIYMASRWAEGSRAGYIDFRFASGSAPGKVIVGFGQKCYFSTTTELSGLHWTTPAVSWTNNQDGTISYIKEITLTNAECLRIYPASEIQILRFPTTYNGTLMKINQALNFAPAKKIVEVSLGTIDGTQPEINISEVSFEGCSLLEKLNLTNCIKYTDKKEEEIKPEDREYSLSFASNLGFRELLAEGSGLVGANFAPNGMLETAKLNKIKKLSLVNLSQLKTLIIQNKDNFQSLRLENCPFVDSYSLLTDAKDTLEEIRLLGINWKTEVATLNLRGETIFNELAQMKGISDRGETISLNDEEHKGSVLGGYAKVAESSTRMETKFKQFWPDMRFEATKFTTEYPVYFYAKEESLWSPEDKPLDEQWLESGEKPTNPATRPNNQKIPTKEQTETEVFAFSTWSDTTIFDYGVSAKTDVWPIFEASPREYIITWQDLNGETLYTQKVYYGEGAEYDYHKLGYPKKDVQGSLTPLFSGWDDYSYSIKRDGVVLKPVFLDGTPAGAPDDGILPNIQQLNATCQYGSTTNTVNTTETPEGIEYSTYEQIFLGLTEKIDAVIGWEPDDDEHCPEDRKPVFDLLKSECKAYKSANKNASATRFDESNPIATIDQPLLLNHTTDSFKYVDTEISLFDNEDSEFTIILDYRFLDSEINSGDYSAGTTKTTQKLLSCSYEDSKGTTYQNLSVGRESGTNPFFAYSGANKRRVNQTMPFGATAGKVVVENPTNEELRRVPADGDINNWSASHADRVIIRRKKGATQLEVFPSYSWYTKHELESLGETAFIGNNGLRCFLVNLNSTNIHSGTVILGAAKKYTGSYAADSNVLCNASISGLKIWKIALSDAEIIKAGNYPKEKLRFWLTEFPRINAHKEGRAQYALTNEDSIEDNLFPGVILELRDFLKNSREFEGTVRIDTLDDQGNVIKTEYKTPNNFDGWTRTATREWLNTRVLEAFPLEWRAAIKPVKIFQLVGTPKVDTSGNPLTSGDYVVDSTHFDYLFNPSYQELWPAELSEPYSLEAAPSSIAYDTQMRRKFFDVGGKWYNAFNRTRTPIITSTGYWRIEPSGALGQGSSKNYKAWVTFALCI